MSASDPRDELKDEPPLLPEYIGARYRIGRELGRGGMARVYLARDLKHMRDVAVKVLRPELAASIGHDRFLREIEIAARLSHPNIVPLYDSGQVDGSLFFVMPYEEGPSLREWIEEAGTIPVADAVNVMRDVARALAYAHEHGVVHRDVKPDNVMLSGGTAVVTDFGIAKALSAARTDGGATGLTHSGTGIGTPAYTAPEQAMGDPATDYRADIYSFGCVAYELLSGVPPFVEASAHLMVAAHVSMVPRPLMTVRADVSAALSVLIARCLEKRPADRPQRMREVLDELDAVAVGGGIVTEPPAVASDRNRDREHQRPSRFRLAVIIAAGLLVLTAAYWFAVRPSMYGAPIALSVLPFYNTVGDSVVEFVSEALSDEVAKAVGRTPGIQIMSRAGARLYAGQFGVDVVEASTRLNADYLVMGWVRQDRGKWLLTVELERGADAVSLWSESFALNPDQQAGSAELVARAIVTALQRQFPKRVGAMPVLASSRRTSSDEAWSLYLRGQERLSRRGQSVREAAELFQQSIREDSSFADAHSGLSLALALFPYFQGVPAYEIEPEVMRAARRALALDSTLAQPHVAIGLIIQHAFRWDSAGKEFRHAVALDPRNVEARVQLARHLRFRGRHVESMEQLRVARELDPASSLVLTWLAYGYRVVRQIDSALIESRRALQYDSTNFPTLMNSALVYLEAGMLDTARDLAQRGLRATAARPYILARIGGQAVAPRLRAELDSVAPRSALPETSLAFLYLGLGDADSALAFLERATDAREGWAALHGPTDPVYDLIRGTPRFRELVRRVGLGTVGTMRRQDRR